LAKSPDRLSPPTTPSFAVSASGAFFTDNEGREWLDCDMGLGAVMWGHCRPEIDGPVIAQVQKGQLFSVPPEIEMIAAELILQRLQRFDWLRFVKTGADAVSGAVRLARALTGRKYVVCGSYHGWHDWSAFHHYGSGGKLGIPDDIGQLTLHLSKERWENAVPYMRAEVAAFVVCPEHWPADELSMLAKSCEKNGSLLIFDEVKSGLRFGPQGVWATRGIIPDLLCLSKGLANGYPLGALIGHAPSKTTAHSIKLSGTYFTDCTSLAAAIACERMLATRPIWPSWHASTRLLLDCATAATTSARHASRRLSVSGDDISIRIHSLDAKPGNDPFRLAFIEGMARHGILSTGFITLSDAHTDAHVTRIEAAVLETIDDWLSSS
jgi:glutamate-1-semialdehyde 2,1-aminomutase